MIIIRLDFFGLNMAGNYLIDVFLPVTSIVLSGFVLFNYLEYRAHNTDSIFGFINRPVTKTKDYQNILALLLEEINEKRAGHLLTADAKVRIEGAAEKAVPQIRAHGRIQIRLPALYEKNGRHHDLVVTLTQGDMQA